MDGIGIYWCIIEMLYEQGGHIPLIDIETIAYELHTECERIKNVLQNFELFKYEGEYFYSESVLRRLESRNKKSSGARDSALKRWHPEASKPDAFALPMQCEGNAIKERKGKKILYNIFYDSEIEKSNNNEQYLKFVKILFGENNLGVPLKSVLKMEQQVTLEQFEKLWFLKEKYKFSITDVLEKMENWKKLNGNTTVYRTFLTFIKRDNPAIVTE